MSIRRVVHIVHCPVDFNREYGGISNIVRAIALNGRANGWQSHVLCGDHEYGRPGVPPVREKVDEWLSREVLPQRSHALLGPVGGLLAALRRLEGPYVAHVHSCFSLFTETAMGYFASRRIPYVFTPHGKLMPGLMGQSSLFKSLWMGLVARGRFNRAARIGLSSPSEEPWLGPLGIKGTVATVPNGYDPIPGWEPSPPSSRRTILYLGYMDPRKQPELLVRAYAQSRCRERYSLTLAGPDPFGHRPRVEEEIQRTGLQDRITLLGPAYGEEKKKLLAQAVCFCLPSKAEGLPVSLVEAVGRGIPLLMSVPCNFGMAAERGAALEVPSFDPADWARALDAMLLEEGRLEGMTRKALELAAELTWPKVAGRWHGVYGELWPLAEKASLSAAPLPAEALP